MVALVPEMGGRDHPTGRRVARHPASGNLIHNPGNLLRDRIEAMRADLDQANAQATAAQDQAEQLRQAEAARRARGVLARLRAAWWGE